MSNILPCQPCLGSSTSKAVEGYLEGLEQAQAAAEQRVEQCAEAYRLQVYATHGGRLAIQSHACLLYTSAFL